VHRPGDRHPGAIVVRETPPLRVTDDRAPRPRDVIWCRFRASRPTRLRLAGIGSKAATNGGNCRPFLRSCNTCGFVDPMTGPGATDPRPADATLG